MAILVGAALAVFSVAIVVYPFLRPRLWARSDGPRAGVGLAGLDLETIYDAIRTLQLEYQLGQIPENLYREQLQGYRPQAAAALRQRINERAGPPDWLLEQEILVARAALGGTDSGPRPCPNCRSLPGPGMAVCPECGAKL